MSVQQCILAIIILPSKLPFHPILPIQFYLLYAFSKMGETDWGIKGTLTDEAGSIEADCLPFLCEGILSLIIYNFPMAIQRRNGTSNDRQTDCTNI